MNDINSNLIESFCLNCNKSKCRGYCKEFRDYMRTLQTSKLIKNRGGRPRKKIECQ